MRRLTTKPDSNSAVMEFVRKGGKITTVKAKLKPVPKNEVEMVEIEVDLLPPELRRFCV